MQAEIVIDFVCKMKKPIEEMQAVSTYMGKQYYFCSQQDKEIFDAHPEHWIPREDRIEEQTKLI